MKMMRFVQPIVQYVAVPDDTPETVDGLESLFEETGWPDVLDCDWDRITDVQKVNR